MGGYINNPQIRRTHEKARGLGSAAHAAVGASDGEAKSGGKHPHSVHIHHAGQGEPKAGNPHHVHVHHADGTHEHSDHGSFDEAMDHAQSKAEGSEPGAALGSESGAPVDGAEMDDGY